MASEQIVKVAIPTPLRRGFDYRLPAATPVAAGIRVKVPFGHQTLTGVVLDVGTTSELPRKQLKPVAAVLDDQPCLSAEVLKLCSWAADYYQYPVGEALATALPAALRRGEPAVGPVRRVWQLTVEGQGLPAGALARAPKQSGALTYLLEQGPQSGETLREAGFNRPTLRQLADKGLAVEVEIAEEVEEAAPADPPSLLAGSPLPLNEEQEAVMKQLHYRAFAPYLLEGATGSGKTEIYLQAIEQVLSAGGSALVLVPEIGLTPQLVDRFRERFQVPLAALHSGLSDKERLHAWLRARAGAARIVIGTRSAIFTPMPRLGLIVIDEEHDLSFKQQEGFRYSARDLAAVRARGLNIPLLLGSATPSLETLYNAIRGRYQHLRLTRRAGASQPPRVELIDVRGQPLHEGLSPPLLEALEETLQRGEQALVFINRRGYAPVLLCHDCGWIAGCHQCSARLTVHYQPPHLHCHHCDHQRPIPRRCPDCQSSTLTHLGQGTERSEHTLREHFPDITIRRVDRDTTRRKNALTQVLAATQAGDPCILVGTQMLAKGHHFPNVTLVAILDVDSGLFSADFRGPERMGQLLIQVAGRAGRAHKPGKVLIQSHHCEHPSIQSLIHEGYHRYARRLLKERQLTGLPPYRFLALVRAESKRPENATEFLKRAREVTAKQFPPDRQLHYLGPLPALMERKKDRFCFQLQINAGDRQVLHRTLAYLCEQMESDALSRRTRWSVDIDPQDMA